MTDKQEKILLAALSLFANDGYNATSTSKIAKKAGVSEGLIFRHFESKRGLLQAIMDQADQRLAFLWHPVFMEENPAEVIRKVIALPFNEQLTKEEHEYWRLLFMLKWDPEFYNPDKIKPLIMKMTTAFSQLGYDHPEDEAVLLGQIIDAVAVERLRNGLQSQEPYRLFLIEKYNL